MRVVIKAFAETPLQAIRDAVLEEMPEPTIGDGDVLVQVKSASVAWVDLLMTSGNYQHMPKPPYTPGLEWAGVVAKVGANVTRVRVGDRVLSDGMHTGPRSLGAYQQWGGFASWAVAPEEGVHVIPDTLSFDEACNLLANYETAYHCLVTRGRLKKGERVMVLGATGATGMAALQVASLVGAETIAVGRNEEKLKHAKADHYGMQKDVDVVYDTVGGEASLAALRCTKFGARFLIVGWASTPFAKSAPNQLPTNLIMMKGLDVLGCPMAISTAKDPSIRQERFDAVMQWAREGRIKPHVSHAFALPEFRQAMQAKWNGEVIGGCVLRP